MHNSLCLMKMRQEVEIASLAKSLKATFIFASPFLVGMFRGLGCISPARGGGELTPRRIGHMERVMVHFQTRWQN